MCLQRRKIRERMESSLYNENVFWFERGNELNVVFSLVSDKELLKLKDAIDFIKKDDIYMTPNFPLCAGGLNHLTYYISYELARRVGKSIKIVGGEVVRCEKDESVWTNLDWREKKVVVKPFIPSVVYDELGRKVGVENRKEIVKKEVIEEEEVREEWV